MVESESADATHEKIRNLVSSESAEIDSWDTPKPRRLAYPIRKEGEVYAGALRFTAAPSAIPQIQDKLKHEKEILRFLLLGWKKPEERRPIFKAPPRHEEAKVPTDEKALDEKLEEILGKNIEHESQ